MKQLYKKYNKLEIVIIIEYNHKLLLSNILIKTMIPLYFRKDTEEFTLFNIYIFLSNFNETFTLIDYYLEKDCYTLLAMWFLEV